MSTRASASFGLTSTEDVTSDNICEVQVQNGTWYVGRMSPKSVGLKSCGSFGRRKQRDECQNFVKRVSLPNPLGPMGIVSCLCTSSDIWFYNFLDDMVLPQ